MEITLTADQQEFLRRAIESGRLTREEDAIAEALSMWEERERARLELLAALDEAEADLEAGRFTEYTDETLFQLPEEIKREGRRRD
jgi:Arc/MetJ-type ribon-helix-helix transcriptional regulator